MKTESRLVVAKGSRGGERMEGELLVDRAFLFEVIKMFRHYIMVMVARHCEYTKNH